jgi:L-fuconolactonase
MVIDVHPHIISDNIEKYPITPLGNKRSKWSEARGSLTAENLIEDMKKAGVDKAVAVHSTTTYGYNCDYIADSAAKYPEVLRGVGCVDFLADDAVEKLNYWINERKLIGIRLFSGGGASSEQATWIINPKTFPAWNWAQETKTPIVMQLRGPSLNLLKELMNKFPNLNLLLDHASSPNLEDGYPYEDLTPVLALSDYRGLVLKVTTVNFRKAVKGRSSTQDFLKALRSSFGAERILWGSNYPSSEGTLSEHVKMAMEACREFSPSERDAFMGDNARRIYNL